MVSIKFVDSAGTPNTVTLNVTRFDFKTDRLLETHVRPSVTTEKQPLIGDLKKSIRDFTFTCVLAGEDITRDMYDTEQMLTKTMPENGPISMFVYDSSDIAVWNGTDVIMHSVVGYMDFDKKGGYTHAEFKVSVVQGSVYG